MEGRKEGRRKDIFQCHVLTFSNVNNRIVIHATCSVLSVVLFLLGTDLAFQCLCLYIEALLLKVSLITRWLSLRKSEH